MTGKNKSLIFFWGTGWGIGEVLGGYLLNLICVIINLNLNWFLLFPLAFYFMNKVSLQTNNTNSIIYSSIIAVLIKSACLICTVQFDLVSSAAVSILFQAIVVWGVFRIWRYLYGGNPQLSLLDTFALSAGWRLFYLFYLSFLSESMIKASPLAGITPFLKFLIIESLVNSVIIYFGWYWSPGTKRLVEA